MNHHQRLKRIVRFICCFLILGMTLPAYADDLQIRGFANLVASKSDNAYNFEYSSFDGNSPSLDAESLLGLNFNKSLGDDVTFAAQLLAEGNDSGRYQTRAEWIFVTYKPGDRFAIRAGRQINPVFLYSEQIDVGFTYSWVRMPYEVYSLLPVKSINGVSLIYTTSIQDLQLRAEVLVGGGDVTIVQPGATYTATASDTKGAEIALSSDSFVVHASYFATATTLVVTTNSKIAGAGGATQAVSAPINIGYYQNAAIGAKFENKQWLAATEVAHAFSDGDVISSETGTYASIGYHVAPRFMPYLTLAWEGDMAGALNTYPDATVSTTPKTGQYSGAIGGNFKATPSMSVKGELMHTEERFADATKNYPISLVSASVNFIF